MTNICDTIGRLDVRNAPDFSKEQIRYLEHIIFNRLHCLYLALASVTNSMYNLPVVERDMGLLSNLERLNAINLDIEGDSKRLRELFADLLTKAHYKEVEEKCSGCGGRCEQKELHKFIGGQ